MTLGDSKKEKCKHKWKKEASLTICEKCGEEKEVSFVEGRYGKYGSPDGQPEVKLVARDRSG